MVNICVMSNGEAVLKFSIAKSGDWVDMKAAIASHETDSVVQVEKENGKWKIGDVDNESRILAAVSVYYMRLIEYVAKLLAAQLNATESLPRFNKPIPVVVSGGTSLADGFVDCFKETLSKFEFPFKIKEVRHAKDPLRAVARGCLIASSI
ncbi:hypothetical protein GF373_17415 [bacterium]|nr:hypothetical protein [bacterium]